MIWVRNHAESAAANSAADLLDQFRTAQGGAQPLGTTITRVRGIFVAQFTATALFSDYVAYGLIVWDRNAVAADLPKPITDPHVDWLSRVPITPYAEPSAGVSNSIVGDRVDSRAMRKMTEMGQTLWLVWEDSGQATTGISWDLSVLLKLA